MVKSQLNRCIQREDAMQSMEVFRPVEYDKLLKLQKILS